MCNMYHSALYTVQYSRSCTILLLAAPARRWRHPAVLPDRRTAGQLVSARLDMTLTNIS